MSAASPPRTDGVQSAPWPWPMSRHAVARLAQDDGPNSWTSPSPRSSVRVVFLAGPRLEPALSNIGPATARAASAPALSAAPQMENSTTHLPSARCSFMAARRNRHADRKGKARLMKRQGRVSFLRRLKAPPFRMTSKASRLSFSSKDMRPRPMSRRVPVFLRLAPRRATYGLPLLLYAVAGWSSVRMALIL